MVVSRRRAAPESVARKSVASSVASPGATTRAAPALGPAFRAAAMDFYYQSIRLVPANVLWGAGLLIILAIAVWVSPILALLAAPLLCLPLVGIVAMAAQVVRGEDVVLSDVAAAIRRHGLAAIATGVVIVAATVVFGINVVAGVRAGDPLGLMLATLAIWGLVAIWVVGLAFWPLLVDPARDAWTIRERARLAGLVVLAQPVRFAGLAAAVAIVTLISAVAFAALLSVAVAFIALVACRVVLPAADTLAASLAGRRASGDA